MKYDFTTLPDRRGKGSEKWNAMLRAKPDVCPEAVPLSIADMEFKNPPEITEGLREFLKDSVLGYTSPTEAYYQAVISWMKRRKHWTVCREEMTCSPGVIPTLYAGVRAFTRPGDGVLLMTPAYPPFYGAVRENGREVIASTLKEVNGRYEMDFEDIEEKTRPEHVRMLFLCSPHNPTGRAWRREELTKLAEICRKNDLIVMADEIHSDLMMPGVEHVVFATLSEDANRRTITCTAPSKTFNLAGMQTSNIVIADPEMRKQFRRELEVSMGGHLLNILGYEACRIAYEECEEWLGELIQVIWENYLYVKNSFETRMPEVKVMPLEGTYLAWLDFRAAGLSAEEMEKLHVEKAEVFLDEGYIFGEEGRGFERLNLACPRFVLEQSVDRLIRAYRG